MRRVEGHTSTHWEQLKRHPKKTKQARNEKVTHTPYAQEKHVLNLISDLILHTEAKILCEERKVTNRKKNKEVEKEEEAAKRCGEKRITIISQHNKHDAEGEFPCSSDSHFIFSPKQFGFKNHTHIPSPHPLVPIVYFFFLRKVSLFPTLQTVCLNMIQQKKEGERLRCFRQSFSCTCCVKV